MDPSLPNVREYQRQVIDAEIKSLEEALRVLKYRRNALAPVFSLPNEIIAAILSFSCVKVASGSTPGKKPDPLAWLRVAHVCHQWREIALNQPLFWSHVNFTALSSAGAAEILARAKMVPLYLEARVLGSHWDNDRYSTFQETLQACVSRICHLHISAKFCDLRKTIDSLVSPAPTLETLSLSSERQLPQPDVPDTLFGGVAPGLSCLELSCCSISWKSPLLKGLRVLQIITPSMETIPTLSDWLDALDEMPQLKTLILHEASPAASYPPFDIERTVTLPSLTHLAITDYPRDCALVLAHLELPALTRLCLRIASLRNVEEVLLYVARHAQIQPLQSILIRGNNRRIDILAWPVPDIDVEVHAPPTLLVAKPPVHVALSITSEDWDRLNNHLEIIGMVMATLPLDGAVTLIAQDLVSPPFENFWHHNSLNWPLLRRVRLTPIVATKFTDWLLEDEGGCENPLLPSLKEVVLVGAELDEHLTLSLCDALKKRVEQGVPLEMLDLRTCSPDPANLGAVRLLSGIVADVLGPEETLDARVQIMSMWDHLDYGPFANDDEANQSDTGHGDGDSDAGGDTRVMMMMNR